jgi:large subunit ribosomal protein L23
MADSLDFIATKLESAVGSGKSLNQAIQTVLQEVYTEHGAVVFEVSMDATKPEIKKAIEGLFNVKVKAVNTTVTKGKVKKFRGKTGRRRDVKKAYVTLVEGNTIDVSTGL